MATQKTPWNVTVTLPFLYEVRAKDEWEAREKALALFDQEDLAALTPTVQVTVDVQKAVKEIQAGLASLTETQEEGDIPF